jgi:hypothetical protein
MLAGAMVVPPQYRQVALWSVGEYDYPEMRPGVAVVASDSAVVAATGADWGDAGPQNVTVSVWLGTTPTSDPTMHQRFVGVIQVGSAGIRVGNLMSGNVFDIDVPEGIHRVEVWANTSIGGPSLVDFRFPEIHDRRASWPNHRR